MGERKVFALLDDASPDGQEAARSRLYDECAGALLCRTGGDWPGLVDALQSALASGLHAVPVLSYALGEALSGIAGGTHSDTAPLAQVLLFRRMRTLAGWQVTDWLECRVAEMDDCLCHEAWVGNMRPNVDEAAFTQAIQRIHAYIAAGDVYQVNYTYRIRFEATGSIFALYARLRARQPVPYGALIALPDGRDVLSLSPELFVRHTDGRLTTRPMKGTAPAEQDTTTDHEQARLLAADPKNRAENLMIVDLLRNDLGQVARTGSVRVPTLFDVQRYGSVLQMTSTVEADLKPGATLHDVVSALYPCGSIAGAPKHRAMQIIRELEPDARDIYTGAMGWIDPLRSNDDPASHVADFCLSVPIRTLVLQPGDGLRQGELGVGAGIVHDSDATAEYQECKLKAAFLTGLAGTNQ